MAVCIRALSLIEESHKGFKGERKEKSLQHPKSAVGFSLKSIEIIP